MVHIFEENIIISSFDQSISLVFSFSAIRIQRLSKGMRLETWTVTLWFATSFSNIIFFLCLQENDEQMRNLVADLKLQCARIKNGKMSAVGSTHTIMIEEALVNFRGIVQIWFDPD